MSAAGKPYGISYRMAADGMQALWWWLTVNGSATRRPANARRFAGRKAAARHMRMISRGWFEFVFQVRPIPSAGAGLVRPANTKRRG
jgi:hypothetical protein